MPVRLAIILSHPTQYYSPWFRHLAERAELQVKVFYLWDSGVKKTVDRTFGKAFTWDIPLLEGYEHEFLPNQSRDPGTHHFRGLDNPGAAAAIRSWKPDALLLFGYTYRTHLQLVLSSSLREIPFLFRGDSHDLYRRKSWKQIMAKQARKLLFRRFERFLAVGAANAGYFRNQGIAEEKVVHVPHCVDNDRFQNAAIQAEANAIKWKHALGIPPDATVVLFAGKFEEKKRPLDLLKVFLSQNHPASVLLFVGSGPLEGALREAAAPELGKSIYFAPFQNQSEMPKVYAAGDVLTLPSFGRAETWGLAVNEAMNLARPAIVSSHVGCGPDLILPSETGWIFKAGDHEDLKRVLVEALSDPARLRTMGKRARVHIGNFSYGRATESLIAALNEFR